MVFKVLFCLVVRVLKKVARALLCSCYVYVINVCDYVMFA